MDDGGQAFPVPGTEYNVSYFGMSLRDYFAAAAMQGILASGDDRSCAVVAKASYEMADAMLRARAKSKLN